MTTVMDNTTKSGVNAIFHWPKTLVWLIPLGAVLLASEQFGCTGTLWWYILVTPLVALIFLDLFTQVWLGISIFIALFLYCSIGSSGVPVSFAIWKPTTWVSIREFRGLEMTEFEWFHWWPFKWLIAMLCLNMSIVTVRKIPFTLLSVGVWSIHSGVILLVLGCLVYFSNKIEGDVLISRGRVHIQIPNEPESSMVVTPNNTIHIGDFTCTITNVNPTWELMSGEDKGVEAYAVSISIEGPDTSFTRQLIAGHPQYTEDIIKTDNPAQPMARAKNVLGTALVDDSIVMLFEQDLQEKFYVTQSGSLYLRELDPSGKPLTPWVERQIDNLPRFNDYVSKGEDVWDWNHSVQPVYSNPLSITTIPTIEHDPVSEPVVITDYLRYSVLDQRIVPGGNMLFPVAWVTLKQAGGISQNVKLFAFDPSANTADSNLMTLVWIEDEAALEALMLSFQPSLDAYIDGEHHNLDMTASQIFIDIGQSGYAYKIQSIQNNLHINNMTVSLVVLELKHGDKQWVRWVFAEDALTRDVVSETEHADNSFTDDRITTTYVPGSAPITITGGPDGKLHALTRTNEVTKTSEIELGESIGITEEVSMTVDRIEPFTSMQTKPAIIPKSQRDPSASNSYSMLRVVLGDPDTEVSAWLPYHHYPFNSIQDSVHRFRYQPTMVQLVNGKLIELMYSRSTAQLPAPVALLNFEIDSHLGGFTGRTSSILNWRSIVSFNGEDGAPVAVSVNDPQPYEGYWFFQSQWDPPSTTSRGLNYTVLGVGNRVGVFTMLLGTCITVTGMLWAFFVKPMIKRKRKQAVHTGLGS